MPPTDNITYSDKTVLIVDDDATFRNALHRILRKQLDVKVVEAPSPKEAFEFLKTTIPDAIILDMQMPYMNGVTVTEHLRKIPTTKHIPILACTGLTHISIVAELIRLHIDDIIAKPFQSAIVVEKLRAIFERSASAPSDNNTTPSP